MSTKTNEFSSLKIKGTEEEIHVVSPFEKLLEAVVADGRYQWTLLITFLIPLSLFYSVASFNFILLLSTPKHHCLVPGRNETNYTAEEWNNLTIPWEQGPDGLMHLSQCKMYNLSQEAAANEESIILNSIPTKDCQYGWEYDTSDWKETPVTKFGWVCDKKHYVTSIFSANLAGSAIGTLLFSMVSDRYGRKLTFYVTLFTNLIFGNALLFAPSYNVFIILKFFGAVIALSLLNTAYIIVIELCSLSLRTIATFTTFLMFIVATGYLSFFGWLLGEWKSFLLVTQLPLALFIMFWRFIPESPRWLLSRGKLDECEKLMTKIARTNGVKFTEEMHDLIVKAHEEGAKKVPVKKIFTSFTLTKHLILIALSQSVGMICSSSLNLNVHKLRGNIFINYLLLRSFELPGDIISTINAPYVGRRMNDVLCLALASIFAMTASFWIAEAWPLIVLCGITKIFLRAAVFSCYIQTGELFPTPLRATAYGIVGICGVSATVLSPSLVALGDSNAQLPYYILCGLCVTGTIISSFLPETMGNPLPQTFKEAKQIGKGQPYFSFHRKGNMSRRVVETKTINVIQEETGSSLSLS